MNITYDLYTFTHLYTSHCKGHNLTVTALHTLLECNASNGGGHKGTGKNDRYTPLIQSKDW